MKKQVVFALVLVLSCGLMVGNALALSEVRVVEIQVSPHVIVFGSEGNWVTVHTDIPLRQVVSNTVKLNGLDAALVKADLQGNLVAKFRLGEVEAIIAPPSAELVLTGVTVDGILFEGAEIVRVRSNSRN